MPKCQTAGVEQQRFAYTYDANGNLLTYRDTVTGGNDWTTAHTFDWADRLLTETRTGGSTANFTNSYVYDKNGNRTSVTRNGVSSAYTVDNNDKMLTGEGFTFNTYDSDGNPTSIAVPGSGTWTLTYDYENRAKTVTKTSGNCSYRYDGEGRRLEKVEGSTTRRYVYDGWTIIAETDGSNNILSYFVPGVGYVENGAQYYYRENAIGSNVAVTNQAGAVQSLSEYDAYGNEYPITTGAKNQFRFAGKHGYQFDESTGLMLLGYRYYAAKLGRFLTQDPIGQKGGLNLYAYCSDNPAVNVDPDGLDKLKLHENPGGVGQGSHLLIGLESSNGKTYWYGFYPEKPSDGSSGSSKGSRNGPGYVKAGDTPKKGGKRSTVDISTAELQGIENAIQRSKSAHDKGTGKKYNFEKYNCADWAAAMIEIGMGINLPSPRPQQKQSAPTTPRNIREWIETWDR